MAARKGVKKTRNAGQWTEARYKSFVVGALRSASGRWPPKYTALKDARVGRGLYKCAACGAIGAQKLPPEKGKTRKRNNAVVDHIEPVVPLTGWVSFDSFIERLFCEKDNFQILCYKCNKEKCSTESTIRREGSAP